MSAGRAARGGEFGRNGEWYEGGKFLPSTKAPKRRGGAKSHARRVEIEPGVFAIAADGQGAIWQSIKALVDNAARMADPAAPIRPIENPTAIEYYGGQAVLDRIAAYNRGERWFAL